MFVCCCELIVRCWFWSDGLHLPVGNGKKGVVTVSLFAEFIDKLVRYLFDHRRLLIFFPSSVINLLLVIHSTAG